MRIQMEKGSQIEEFLLSYSLHGCSNTDWIAVVHGGVGDLHHSKPDQPQACTVLHLQHEFSSMVCCTKILAAG